MVAHFLEVMFTTKCLGFWEFDRNTTKNQQHSLLHVRKLAAYDVALCVDFFFNTFFRCHDKLSFHWFWSQQTSQQKGGFTYIEHGDYT